ncbi:PQQ-binding-like beta-propeller repeat protein [Microbulbifer harenosus]|uniref:Pyrrolo-quinoline quinone repeat domain-containing protein n=1 Tax=Microbulbifer harenosus TaxID=2576840 RepID=A0ABY2UIU1_9GAMM|nr:MULTISPECIES: PQQ-binding-like beta-propeller repeat protein [Microbulbifer]QIL88608.1 PQQ-binding-like beta-propeller repeat protein [Microbulbifer sp. SH-1]TLM76100.1 hypothetical protein FDY93_14135 [Microbulbifer harenosus]
MLKNILMALALAASGLLQAETDSALAWQFEAPDMVIGKPVLDGDTIYTSAGKHLFALDKSGHKRWQYDAGAAIAAAVALAGERILLHADNGVHALDRHGRRLWFFAAQDAEATTDGTSWGWGEGRFSRTWAWYRSAPLVVGERIFVGIGGGVQALSLSDGKPLWRQETGVVHTDPVHHEGIVIVGSWDNHLYGLDAQSGDIAWQFVGRLPQGAMAGWDGWPGFNLTPQLHGGRVYVGSRGAYFYSIDARTGVEQWSSKYANSWIGSPATISGGTVYFGLSDGLGVMGQDLNNGHLKFFAPTNHLVFAQPAIAGRELVVGTLAGELFAVDLETGARRALFQSTRSRANQAIYVRPEGGIRMDEEAEKDGSHAGSVAYMRRMLSGLDAILNLTTDGSYVYAGTAGGKLYAVRL